MIFKSHFHFEVELFNCLACKVKRQNLLQTAKIRFIQATLRKDSLNFSKNSRASPTPQCLKFIGLVILFS